MDGVIADFEGALKAKNSSAGKMLDDAVAKYAPELAGASYDDLKAEFKGEQKDPARAKVKKAFGFFKKQLYKLGNTKGFFRELDVLPGADQLFSKAAELNGGKLPHILTAPMKSKHCESEKRAWAEEHFGGKFDKFICQQNKAEYAAPDSVLIDDRAKYVSAWTGAGGVSIVHTSVPKSLKELEEFFNSEKEGVLDEANAANDREATAKANGFVDIVKQILTSEEDKEWITQNARRVDKYGGFLLTPDYSNEWKKLYPDLYVVIGSQVSFDSPGGLAQKKSVEGGYGPLAGGNHLIVVSSLESPYDLKFADTRLSSGARTTLVHEFIHYLDSKRTIDPTSITRSASAQSSTEEEYYNDPREFNAHYQEAMNGFERRLNMIMDPDNTVPDRFKQAMLKKLDTYQSFEDHILKTFMDKDFVANLDDKYEKKLLSRLYGAYEEYKQVIDKGIEGLVNEMVDDALEEQAAISTGGAGMQSLGQVSGTSTGAGAWGKNNPQHELMWSGDGPANRKTPNGKKKKRDDQ